MIFGATIYFLNSMWEIYTNDSVIVTTESKNFPLYEVNFPGVAICNVNKISKKKAVAFANYL